MVLEAAGVISPSVTSVGKELHQQTSLRSPDP